MNPDNYQKLLKFAGYIAILNNEDQRKVNGQILTERIFKLATCKSGALLDYNS